MPQPSVARPTHTRPDVPLERATFKLQTSVPLVTTGPARLTCRAILAGGKVPEMADLTKEEREHPDVRAYWPHLVGRSRRVPAHYDLKAVWLLWLKLYPQDEPFFPVTTISIPGRTGDDAFDWWGRQSIEQGKHGGTVKRRPGEETTINLMTDTEDLTDEDRRAVFIYVTLRAVGLAEVDWYRSRWGLIPQAIGARLFHTIIKQHPNNTVHSYHHRCSSFIPWRLPWAYPQDKQKLANVRSLADLIRLLVEIARHAQAHGGFVRVRSAPDELLTVRTRRMGGHLLEQAIQAFRFEDYRSALEFAGEATQTLHRALELEEVVSTTTQKRRR